VSSQVFRHSFRDAWLVALSVLHLILLGAAPSIPLIALGVWWNSNTISHYFLHLPFFRSNTLNRIYSLYLSVLLGIPQSVWRERHLAHHRSVAAPLRWTSAAATEMTIIAALWGILLVLAPRFFLMVYVPGIAAGLMLCYLHGYFEHAGGTTSNYGGLYNFAFFNDGYHVEHHERPSEHWTRMQEIAVENPRTSRWPAILRWMEIFNLETLERIVLQSKLLQSFLLKTHGRALQKLLNNLPVPERIVIIGGGMYPRTAILMRRLFPAARIRIVDSNREHLDMAKAFVGEDIRFEHAYFRCEDQQEDSDLLIVPLSFRGCREAAYRNPPARAVLVHDWLWNQQGRSAIVSVLLLKRLNLILR
jgi:Fatty acid desaturase